MLRRVLHEMEFPRCQFLDLRKHFDTLVDMVASLCQRGSKVFLHHVEQEPWRAPKTNGLHFILRHPLSRKFLQFECLHLLRFKNGAVVHVSSAINWNDGKIIIEYNLPLKKIMFCSSTYAAMHASSELIEEKIMKHDFLLNWMKRLAAICPIYQLD